MNLHLAGAISPLHSVYRRVRVCLAGAKWRFILTLSSPVTLARSYKKSKSFTLFTDKTSPEDKANPLSLLSFWWLQPLMKRGAKGLIQRPADLPQLPTSLSTSAISNKFCKILQKGHQQISNQPHNLDEQEIRSLGRMSSSSSSLSSTGQRDEAASTVSSSTSLFFALNKAFGWHYYPLGLLKLLSDALGFAGPLLLHSLVSFIENHNVSVH